MWLSWESNLQSSNLQCSTLPTEIVKLNGDDTLNYLGDKSVSTLESSLDPLWRLVGELDGRLQKVDRELLVLL